MAYKCPYCKTGFRNKYNLTTHQKKAKYCLSIREPQNQCYACKEIFKGDALLTMHESTCVSFLREELRKVKEEKEKSDQKVIKLELKLAESGICRDIYKEEYKAIRDKPTTTYNSSSITNKLGNINIATIEPFTIDTVRKKLENGGYTYDLFVQGIKGVQKFILDMVIKNDEKSYATTDISRPNFHRLEETKRWVGDKGALFIGKAFDEMKSSTIDHFNRLQEELAIAGKQHDMEKLQELDDIREATRDSLTGIIRPESAQRKELLTEVIKYVKPYVAI